MSVAKLREIEISAKRAMLMFKDALSQHTEALHLGQEGCASVARQYAHDALDAYLDHLTALHGGK